MSPPDRDPTLALAYVMAAMGGASFGLVLPVLPDLLAAVGAPDSGTASRMGGWLIAAFAVMQLFAAPAFGVLSDRYGRKPFLLLALATGAIGHLAMALAPTIETLIAARALTGLSAAAFVALSAMIADRVAPDRRATIFGRLSAADGIGLVAGPSVVGLVAEHNLRAPFVLIAGLEMLLLIAVALILRETLCAAARRPVAWAEATPFKSLRRTARQPGNAPLLWVVSLMGLGMLCLPITWAYFTELRFDWGPAEIGLSMSILGLASIAANGVVLPCLRRWMSDHAILGLVLGLGPVLMVWLALNTSEALLFVLIALLAQTGLAFSILTGMLSANTPAAHQGSLQGGLGVLDSLTEILAPFLYPWVFATAIGIAPAWAGAPFLLGAVITFGGIFFLAAGRPRPAAHRD